MTSISARIPIRTPERSSMSYEPPFKSPQAAVDQINAAEQGDETTLAQKARRALRATLWIGAHYGHGLPGIPASLRQRFIDEIDLIVAELSPYKDHYPEFVPEDSEPEPLNIEQELAIDYRYLQEHLRNAGLRY